MTAPRGILALLDDGYGTPFRYYPYNLQEQEFNPKNVHTSRRRRRRRNDIDGIVKSDEEDLRVNHQTNDFSISNSIETCYDCSKAEFTLFYFCDSHCRHSARFTPILSRFLQQSTSNNEDDSDNELLACLVVCIPNDELLTDEKFICGGTGFWCISPLHRNRSIISRILCVTVVPTLVVVNNKTGRILTDMGMLAIENNHKPTCLINNWRNGDSGVPILARIGCFIS